MTPSQRYALSSFGALGKAIFFVIRCCIEWFWKTSLRSLRHLMEASRSPLASVWHVICAVAWESFIILVSLTYLFGFLLLVATVIAVAVFLAGAVIVMVS